MRKLTVAAIVGVAVLAVTVAINSRNHIAQAKVDARIVADSHALIEQYLAQLEPDDPIIRRYGLFQGWERGDWSRPNYAFRLVSRLDARGVAHFDKADVEVTVMITAGPQRVTLTMSPTDEWLFEQPDRHLEVVGRDMFISYPDGRTRCSIQAAATHPDFVAD